MPPGRRLSRALLLGMVVLAAIACDAKYPAGPTDPAPIAALTVQYRAAMADPRVGTTFSYIAFTVDTDGVYRDVTAQATWYSADPLVVRASPGSSATLLAVGPGATEILASYAGRTASIATFVRPVPEPYPHLEFSSMGTPPLDSFANVRLQLYESPTRRREVTTIAAWSSSNPNVATAAAGVVTAAGLGTTRISASYEGLSASYGVSILPR